MNDVDPFHNTNCFPVKFSHDNVVLKKIVTKKVFQCGEEFRIPLRLRVKCPWKKLKFAERKKLSEFGEVTESEYAEIKKWRIEEI